MSQRAFNKKHNLKLQMTYGASQDELLPWHVFRAAVATFWSDVLDLAAEKSFRCISCGDRPENLVIDGVSIGIKVSSLKDKADLFLPFDGESLLDAPTYKERMFLKLKKDRDLLKSSLKLGTYPTISTRNGSDSHLVAVKDFTVGMKKSGFSAPPKSYLDLLKDLSSASSTVTMFQPCDTDLLKKLRDSLDKPDNVLRDTKLSNLQTELRSLYPVFMDRLEGLALPAGPDGEHLPLHVRSFINKLLDFVIKYQEELPVRTSTDYTERKEGEILGQLTPLFPIRYI
jgi:hypothetical protein